MLRLLLPVLFLAAAPAWASGPCGTTDVIAELSDEDRARLDARAEAEPYGEGTLFRAEKAGSTVTVVGTIHIPDPRLEPVVDKLRPVIRDADLLILEMTAEDEGVMQRMAAEQPDFFFLTEGPTLIDLLSEEDWSLASEQLEARGIPPFFAAKFKPWYLSLTLGLPPCVVQVIASGEKGLDRQLEEIAVAADVPRAALDEPDILLDIFGRDSLEDQLDVLRFGLRSDMNGDAMISTLMIAYFDGRIAESWALNGLLAEDLDGGRWLEDMQEFEAEILTGRNRQWEEKLAPLIDGKDVVLAVGAAHLFGETGVVRALERAGYSISRF